MTTYDSPYCKNGHEWLWNLRYDTNGYRYCRACRYYQQTKSRAKARAAQAQAAQAEAEHYACIALYAAKRAAKAKRKLAKAQAKAKKAYRKSLNAKH